MSEPEEGSSQYLVLEIPDEELLFAIAEDGRLDDRALDALESEIRDPGCDSGWAAAVALTIGRSGRGSSVGVLSALRQRLATSGHETEALAVALAIELLRPRPGSQVERADSGYRFVDAQSGQEVFVEDPIAAHWHRQGRWGPPIRPDHQRSLLVLKPQTELEGALAFAREGGIVLATVRPDWLGRPAAPLRITKAGLARDPQLSALTRFSRLRSVGVVERRGRSRLAYEPRGEALVVLPEAEAWPAAQLADLLGRLLNDARS